MTRNELKETAEALVAAEDTARALREKLTERLAAIARLLRAGWRSYDLESCDIRGIRLVWTENAWGDVETRTATYPLSYLWATDEEILAAEKKREETDARNRRIEKLERAVEDLNTAAVEAARQAEMLPARLGQLRNDHDRLRKELEALRE